MNGKLSSDLAPDSLSSELLNPFVHHLELETTYEKVKVSFLIFFVENPRVDHTSKIMNY